jgi:ABC-type branched-subunit amino acid transport system substrate-binding protein
MGVGAAVTAVVAAAVVAGCGSSGDGGGGSSSKSKEPLVVGLVSPQGGALATMGVDAIRGWQIAADEVNARGGVDGHKVKLVLRDTNNTPDMTIRQARAAVTKDGAHYLGAILTSGETGALAPQLASMRAVNLVSISKDDVVTGESCSPNMYRTTSSGSMDIEAAASVLAKLPAKKWATQTIDTVYGHSATKTFAEYARKAGKQVVSSQYSPIGTTEFGSNISKILDSGADGLFVIESGADGVAFVKQASQFKLFDKVKSVLSDSTLFDPSFKAMGDPIVGWYSKVTYAPTLDNPMNKAFVAAWKKKYGSEPWYVPAESYIAAQFLFDAVRKAKSVDVEKVKAAMNTLSMDTIGGQLRMRPGDHQALRDVAVGRIVKQADGVGWKIVGSVPPDKTTSGPSPACKM